MELQLRLPGDWPAGRQSRSPPDPDGDDLEAVLALE